MKNENRLRELSNSIKHNNIYIIGIPEREEGEKGAENLFEEIRAEKFPDLGKETDIQISKAQTASNKINPKRSTPGHIVIKMSKVMTKREF